MYPLRWKMRSFRNRSRETRLAVMFATAPLSKVRRAFAMSTSVVITGIPAAERSVTLDPTTVCTRSMSWIMRSSTTGTSAPRGLNGASRLISTKPGWSTYGSAARTARLNRSTWPICTITPAFFAAASISSASSIVAAIGFSMSTCLPAASARIVTA